MQAQQTAAAPAASPGQAAAARSSLAEAAAALLHKRCRIRVRDGRVLVGELSCLDGQGNIILASCYEHMTVDGQPHEKLMGQVLVPAAHRVSCEFQTLPGYAQQLRALLSSGGGGGGSS